MASNITIFIGKEAILVEVGYGSINQII